MLSIIVPTLNEADCIAATLRALQPLRARGAEVIVVDGGSEDDTFAQARDLCDRALVAPRGRARQQNAGASFARGDTLLFLHADTLVPPDVDALIAEAMCDKTIVWGRFDVRFYPTTWPLALVAWAMNLRSRHTGIATGDQALFVRRSAFAQVGKFPDQPLMEDIALSKKLRTLSPPAALRARVTTAARRWQRYGVGRTIVRMWLLRFAYFLGVPAAQLSRHYSNER
jgi:rSAM/selenodomain-associated transferase 2